MSKEALLNTAGLIRGLQWVLQVGDPLVLGNLLDEIEKLTEGPGFNPQQMVIE